MLALYPPSIEYMFMPRPVYYRNIKRGVCKKCFCFLIKIVLRFTHVHIFGTIVLSFLGRLLSNCCSLWPNHPSILFVFSQLGTVNASLVLTDCARL